ncbi:MAG: hypothetical protein H0W61_04510 [Bacteroidetes bacterium]|nr:hypothetical protein [Bacteroidota bacterium]
MKKLILLAAIIGTGLLSSCGPSQKDAITYNDGIMDLIDALKTEHTLFIGQIDGHNVDSLKISHTLFADKAKKSLEESKKYGPFAEKKDFSNATHDYFMAMNSIAVNEGRQMVEIMSKDSAHVTQDDLDKITALANTFDETYSKAYDKLQAEQIKFSKEWKFELIETSK